MNAQPLTNQEIAAQGEALYQRDIRPHVETDNQGKFLILDINTGEYEIDAQDLVASERLLQRCPDGVLYGVRVGYASAYKIGGRVRRV